MANVLSVISVCGKTGGTTVKLKKLVEESRHNHSVYFALSDSQIVKDFPENKKWFESTNVKVYEGFYGKNIFRYALAINKVIKEQNIDIVHFYFNFENTFAPILKLLNPKVVLIRSVVGYDEPLSILRSLVLKMVLKPVDRIIYVSNYIKKLYEHDYPVLKEKNSEVIYNSAIHISDKISDVASRKSLVSVSGLCKRKNLAVLVNAIGKVVHDHKIDCKLYILGDGPSRSELEVLIQKLKIEENVILLGYSTAVTEYLNKCSIYVHPADTEGFGIAITEAMYMKCPTIVSNAGALPELTEEGVNGFIVDPYNADQWASKIVHLLENEEVRIKMGNASHERALKLFPMESFINNHDALYEKV
ncbi:Glycosyltransferase involved in cell wall bisynthesis [Flavobacterium gillisiae]|uniref:Glycosyltransferase involved in cell wall bisynthesis n=2 Tax=Flavobacterium gillisiae TaxID=150146 RepID=A0A1H3ZQB1_9FLAO|nr:Glycosyltransferase involved in cell wall bisynthesis [Flavobacterium gillisiae]